MRILFFILVGLIYCNVSTANSLSCADLSGTYLADVSKVSLANYDEWEITQVDCTKILNRYRRHLKSGEKTDWFERESIMDGQSRDNTSYTWVQGGFEQFDKGYFSGGTVDQRTVFTLDPHGNITTKWRAEHEDGRVTRWVTPDTDDGTWQADYWVRQGN